MNKKLLIMLLTITLAHNTISLRADAQAILVPLAAATGFFATGTWFAKETIRDMGFRFIDLKRVYFVTQDDLHDESKGLLTEKEIEFFSRLQAITAIPEVYWREITSSAITATLFYLGAKCLRKAIRESNPLFY